LTDEGFTVHIRLNAALDQTPQMEAKLPINAALELTLLALNQKNNKKNLGTNW